jgi:DNA-binding FrmR family transcriptional regulator
MTATNQVVHDEQALEDLVKRLRRAEGQIGGIVRMLNDGRSCDEIVHQLAAVSKAIDRAAFALISAGIKECFETGAEDADQVIGRLQKLFLTMA